MNALKAYSAKHTKTKYTDSSFAYAQPSSTTFPDRDPVDVVRQKVADAIDDFLANPTDTVIKAPCGIGKSTYMAQRLAALPWNTKVLYLAPTHELAEEVENKVRNEIITLNRKAGLPRYGSQTTRIQGRTRQHKGGLRLCEDDFAYDQWLSKGFSSQPIIVWHACTTRALTSNSLDRLPTYASQHMQIYEIIPATGKVDIGIPQMDCMQFAIWTYIRKKKPISFTGPPYRELGTGNPTS